jgi:uncharacterized protein (TIGR03067 family)
MYASVLIGLTVTVAAPAPKEAPKKEATIIGEWVGEKMVAGGQERPAPKDGITFTFSADGKMTVKEAARGKSEDISYKIDAKKDPREIDMMPPEKGNAGTFPSITGIYKIEGDTLTICFSVAGTRPTAFASPAGTMTMLMTLKRLKKE